MSKTQTMECLISNIREAVRCSWVLEMRSKNSENENLEDLATKNRENLETLARLVKIDLEELKKEALS